MTSRTQIATEDMKARGPCSMHAGGSRRALPVSLGALVTALTGCASSPDAVEPPAAPLAVPLREAMQAGAVTTDPLFWRVLPQGGATIYVLGSIHFGPPGGWRLPDAVNRAFEQSDTLVVDDRGASPQQIQAITMRYALAPRGSSLKDLLPPETFALLERLFAAASATVEPMMPFRPWMTATLLTVGAITETGFDPSTGIDRVFLDQAGEREVIELESLEIQLAIFGGLSPDLDAFFLAATLDQLSDVDTMRLDLSEAWRTGDEPSLVAQLLDTYDANDPDHQEIRARLFTDRDISMAEQLAVLATDPARARQQVFVVVGTGHLVGGADVLTMLESKGLSIERLGPTSAAADAR